MSDHVASASEAMKGVSVSMTGDLSSSSSRFRAVCEHAGPSCDPSPEAAYTPASTQVGSEEDVEDIEEIEDEDISYMSDDLSEAGLSSAQSPPPVIYAAGTYAERISSIFGGLREERRRMAGSESPQCSNSGKSDNPKDQNGVPLDIDPKGETLKLGIWAKLGLDPKKPVRVVLLHQDDGVHRGGLTWEQVGPHIAERLLESIETTICADNLQQTFVDNQLIDLKKDAFAYRNEILDLRRQLAATSSDPAVLSEADPERAFAAFKEPVDGLERLNDRCAGLGHERFRSSPYDRLVMW